MGISGQQWEGKQLGRDGFSSPNYALATVKLLGHSGFAYDLPLLPKRRKLHIVTHIYLPAEGSGRLCRGHAEKPTPHGKYSLPVDMSHARSTSVGP